MQLNLFLESLRDCISWLGYELCLSNTPVFLTQKHKRRLRKVNLWLRGHRHTLGLVALVFAAVLADLNIHWSTWIASFIGLHMLWTTADRLLYVLLSAIGLIIPFAILAVTLMRNELGPRLADALIVKMRVFALLALGIALAITLGFLVPRGSYQVDVLQKTDFSLWVHRLGVWVILFTLMFFFLSLTWLGRVQDVLIGYRRFALISNLAIREYGAVKQRLRDFNAHRELTRKICEGLGLLFVAFPAWAIGRPAIEAPRRGQIVDINLRRLEKLVSKLDRVLKNKLVIVAWPGSFVEKGQPLIMIKGDAELDDEISAALRSCFRIGRGQRRWRRASSMDVIELVTESACRSAGDPSSLAQWIDLLGQLAELGDPDTLDWEIYRGMSQIVKHVAERGTEESQTVVAERLYRQGYERLQRGAHQAVQEYLSILKWFFHCSLHAKAERGIDRSVYYMLWLGMDTVKYARSEPNGRKIKVLIEVLETLVRQIAEMIVEALTVDRKRLGQELLEEVIKLVRGEAFNVLFSVHESSDSDENLQMVIKAEERLKAVFEASGFYLGALVIQRALQGYLNPEAAANGFELALRWARTPAELFAALERIEAHRLWMGPERFHEREIISPLGETFVGDDRAPFLEVYILGSVAKASSSTHWPTKESTLAQRIWPTLQILCHRIRSNSSRYKTIMPQLTDEVLGQFERAHRQLVKITEEREREEIKQAKLSEKAVAGFRETAVESFRMNSVLWTCFNMIAPHKLRKIDKAPETDNNFKINVPKEAFVRDTPPMFIAPGDRWALWNDNVCLDAIKLSKSVSYDLDEAARQMADLNLSPELVLISPKTRRQIRQMVGFHQLPQAEGTGWTGQAVPIGLWLDRPILVAMSVPEEEVWLLNLSESCELVEYTEAKPCIEVIPDRPLEVDIIFPQRLELRVTNPAGVMRVRLVPERMEGER